ncbi:MAG: universal stress protein [Chitinophagaceae bacterium]
MQTILVPLDFSPASNNALIYAANLAKEINAGLFLFHAYILPTPISEMPYLMIPTDDVHQANEKLLKQKADQIISDFNIEIRWEARMGMPSDEIKFIIIEQKIELVVMGMRGSGVVDKIIGSTTINVINKVKTPVLILPSDTVYRRLSSIVYASDFSYKTNFHLFDPLLQLANKYNATISVLHIELTNTEEPVTQLMGKKELAAIFARHEHRFIYLKEKSVTAGINLYIQKNDTNLLVVVAHKHDFFERFFTVNHTKAMAYKTRVPMLVLQDKE